jgi:hypothetical protein
MVQMPYKRMFHCNLFMYAPVHRTYAKALGSIPSAKILGGLSFIWLRSYLGAGSQPGQSHRQRPGWTAATRQCDPPRRAVATTRAAAASSQTCSRCPARLCTPQPAGHQKLTLGGGARSTQTDRHVRRHATSDARAGVREGKEREERRTAVTHPLTVRG